jgi:ABC-type antimicrobial peptide transport system permease subunit
VADVKELNRVIDSSVATPRLTFVLVGLFAGLAIILAAIGTYGVISYTVSQRTSEFGLRVALGAQRTDLLRMVLVQSTRLAVAGTLIGVALAFSLGRVVKSLTYAVSVSDPAILGSVILLVLGAALLASYIPARRAAGADPMSTLRTE